MGGGTIHTWEGEHSTNILGCKAKALEFSAAHSPEWKYLKMFLKILASRCTVFVVISMSRVETSFCIDVVLNELLKRYLWDSEVFDIDYLKISSVMEGKDRK